MKRPFRKTLILVKLAVKEFFINGVTEDGIIDRVQFTYPMVGELTIRKIIRELSGVGCLVSHKS